MPDLPLFEVWSNISDFEGKQYLLTVDHDYKFVEENDLKDITARSVIEALKQQFCRHGIPEKQRCDSGNQYMSEEFAQFFKDFDIIHRIH